MGHLNCIMIVFSIIFYLMDPFHSSKNLSALVVTYLFFNLVYFCFCSVDKNPTPLTNPEVLTVLKERIESASARSTGAINSEQEVKFQNQFEFQSSSFFASF